MVPSQPKTASSSVRGSDDEYPLHRIIERLDKGNICDKLSTAVGTEQMLGCVLAGEAVVVGTAVPSSQV